MTRVIRVGGCRMREDAPSRAEQIPFVDLGTEIGKRIRS